jgi:hypothetical protein
MQELNPTDLCEERFHHAGDDFGRTEGTEALDECEQTPGILMRKFTGDHIDITTYRPGNHLLQIFEVMTVCEGRAASK